MNVGDTRGDIDVLVQSVGPGDGLQSIEARLSDRRQDRLIPGRGGRRSAPYQGLCLANSSFRPIISGLWILST